TLSSFAPIILYLRFFFFQAEDGIRDFHVTGVQTCALPISPSSPPSSPPPSPSPPLSPFPVSGGVGSPPEWLLLSPPQALRNKDKRITSQVARHPTGLNAFISKLRNHDKDWARTLENGGDQAVTMKCHFNNKSANTDRYVHRYWRSDGR